MGIIEIIVRMLKSMGNNPVLASITFYGEN